jgi:hypothetical protein
MYVDEGDHHDLEDSKLSSVYSEEIEGESEAIGMNLDNQIKSSKNTNPNLPKIS